MRRFNSLAPGRSESDSKNVIFNLILLKGAVSYRFSQGLLTLMCNNSKLKADINFFFFLLRRQTSKVHNWLQKFTIQHPVALL